MLSGFLTTVCHVTVFATDTPAVIILSPYITAMHTQLEIQIRITRIVITYIIQASYNVNVDVKLHISFVIMIICDSNRGIILVFCWCFLQGSECIWGQSSCKRGHPAAKGLPRCCCRIWHGKKWSVFYEPPVWVNIKRSKWKVEILSRLLWLFN